jgi:hypothetical protein
MPSAANVRVPVINVTLLDVPVAAGAAVEGVGVAATAPSQQGGHERIA